MVHAIELAGTGCIPGTGRTAGFGHEDGEEHPEQAHQEADDGEAASEHLRGVSLNTPSKCPDATEPALMPAFICGSK
ncbi:MULTISPECIES: hypothetical protein [unclassified Mesorhizobium]|uniref:hypothetical protein n=1 Tax=unclassified Mesorhizobium TaxID=325217 RepID=UPI00333725F5